MRGLWRTVHAARFVAAAVAIRCNVDLNLTSLTISFKLLRQRTRGDHCARKLLVSCATSHGIQARHRMWTWLSCARAVPSRLNAVGSGQTLAFVCSTLGANTSHQQSMKRFPAKANRNVGHVMKWFLMPLARKQNHKLLPGGDRNNTVHSSKTITHGMN